jgi:hypothetical protein
MTYPELLNRAPPASDNFNMSEIDGLNLYPLKKGHHYHSIGSHDHNPLHEKKR